MSVAQQASKQQTSMARPVIPLRPDGSASATRADRLAHMPSQPSREDAPWPSRPCSSRFGAQHDDLVIRAHHGVGRRVELVAALPLVADTHDDGVCGAGEEEALLLEVEQGDKDTSLKSLWSSRWI